MAYSYDFTNKTVLITGGTSGMGLATAEAIVAAGGDVIITGRTEARLDAARERLAAFGGGTVTALRADAALLTDTDALMKKVSDSTDHLDGLFANAGTGIFKPVSAITEADFDATFDVNVKGTFFLIQRAIPLLAAAREGAAVVLNASWTLHRGMDISSAYSASKAAVHNLARTFGTALSPMRIRVNSVSPGFIATDMLGLPSDDSSALDALAAQVPLSRVGTPEEVAKAVLFLLSDNSSYINAQDVIVDGGLVGALPGSVAAAA